MEVGEFYTTEKKRTPEDYGMSELEVLQVLKSEGPFLYVKDWQRGYSRGDCRYVFDSRDIHLRCLSDDFVAFITGDPE